MSAGWLRLLPRDLRRTMAENVEYRRVLGNGSWLLADRFLRLVVGLTISVWMARYLGPADFGKISYAIAFSALFSVIASLGVDSIAVRDLVRFPSAKSEIVGSVFALKLLGGCLAFIAAVATIWLLDPADEQAIALVAIISAGFIFQGFDAADVWFQSQVLSKFTVLARGVPFLCAAAIRTWLILSHASLSAFAWAMTAEVLLTAAGFAVVYRVSGNLWHELRPGLLEMRRLLSECWPLALSGLAIMLYMRIDQVMLARMIDDREVGLYSAALRLSEIWYVLPAIAVSSLLPGLTRSKSSSEREYYSNIRALFRILVRVAVLIALVVSLLADPLIRVLYGNRYEGAGTILSIHVWAAVFVFLGVGLGPWIVNEGLQRFSLFQTVLGAVTNVALNLLFIPKAGAAGAAMATLLAQFVAVVVALAFFRRTRPMLRIVATSLVSFWRTTR